MTIGAEPPQLVHDEPPPLGRRRRSLESLVGGGAGTAVVLTVLVVVSAWVRTRALHAAFWIDEGLSVGIAGHALHSIPGVLSRDGSPPLYFMLLHVWMQVVGDGETRTHALSLLFAILTVPAALWAGWSLAGRRVGWTCAVLAAANPFLTLYAQETRMYSLIVLLGVVCSACFLHAFTFGRRRYVAPFGLSLAALLYTHNWALFFAVAALAAIAPAIAPRPDRRAALRDAALGFGIAAVLYLPWIPTLVSQAAHTGAPWSRAPKVSGIWANVSVLLGTQGVVAVLLAGGAGLFVVLRRDDRRERASVVALAVMTAGTYALAFAASSVQPAWAPRYLAMVLAPLLLLAGLALARAGGIGVGALVIVAIWGWVVPTQVTNKSNVKDIARQLHAQLRPGDLVVTTQPEQVAVLSYYLPPGLRYADETGLVRDPRVMDWRDAVSRLRASTVAADLRPLVRGMRPGARVLLVAPTHVGGATWTTLVRRRSTQWTRALRGDPELRLVRVAASHRHAVAYSRVVGLLFERLPA